MLLVRGQLPHADVLMFYDKWTLEDLTESMNIPCELACNVPTFCIVDNDDFKVDTLTGNSQKGHRTNFMFVQPECIENKSDGHNTNSKTRVKYLRVRRKDSRLDTCNTLQAAERSE